MNNKTNKVRFRCIISKFDSTFILFLIWVFDPGK